jgi:hypothetical protein
MPKNKMTDPITDQEMEFARLVLFGKMTDTEAAEAAGLNPNSAGYIKGKPAVQTYMIQHRAAVERQLIEDDVELQRQRNQSRERSRERALARLWEIAEFSLEKSRGLGGIQIKAIALIADIEGFAPDRRRGAPRTEPEAPQPVRGTMYKAKWLRDQEASQGIPQDECYDDTEDEIGAETPAQQQVEPAAPPEPPTPPKAPVPPKQVNYGAPRVPGADFEPESRARSPRWDPFSGPISFG